MDTSMEALSMLAGAGASWISLFPFYAMFRCAVSSLKILPKAGFILLMILFWPWGFLVYAFTLGREKILQFGATFISIVIIISFVYAGIWNRRVKEGEDPKKDVWGVVAYATTVNTISSLTRPVYYYKILTGEVKSPEIRMPAFGGLSYQSVASFGPPEDSDADDYDSAVNYFDEISPKSKSPGGVGLNSVKLGPVTQEQRRKLPKKLEVEFEGGARFPVEMGSGERDALMIKAAREGNLDTVRELVRLGAGSSALSDSGYTPLMEAVQYGYEDIARFLIENGADIRYQAEDGETALTLAQKNFRKETEALLAEKL